MHSGPATPCWGPFGSEWLWELGKHVWGYPIVRSCDRSQEGNDEREGDGAAASYSTRKRAGVHQGRSCRSMTQAGQGVGLALELANGPRDDLQQIYWKRAIRKRPLDSAA